MKRFRCLALAVCVLAIAEIATATVFEKVTDNQLVDHADAVVIGVVQNAASRQTADGTIVTDYHVVVEDALKGTVPDVLTITEIGGTVGTRFAFIADSATYTPGERILAFLKRRSDGTFFTTSMALGKFTFDGAYVMRNAEELEDDPLRAADAFQSYVRRRARGEAANANYVSASAAPKRRIAVNGMAKQYALTASGFPVRWFTSSVPFLVNGSLGFNTTNGINAGLAAWTNDPGSNINLSNAGSTAISAPDQNDMKNVILLGYTGSDQGFCDGTLGCTIGAGNFTNTFDGDTWVVIDDADIIVRPAVSAAQFDSLITHELGHAIGIRHANTGTPSSSTAIMAFPVNAALGTTLQQWDKDAVDSLYGNGPVCQPPSNVMVNGGGTVASGSMVRLTATASGSATLNYQWYEGNSGDTSTPVGANSSAFTTPPITTQKNYWVRVTNSCGSSDSATVTLTPQACQRPAITVDPQSQTIMAGGMATLTVGNTGTAPLTYQWYVGQSGDISNPILGANASQFTTPNLTQTTSYWVRVSNACGSADSRTATITIPGSCVAPSFTIQPAGLTLDSGQQTFLAATATDATSYQWFKGAAGDESNPMTGTTPSNARFVNQLFIDVLHRPADVAAVGAFTSALDSSSLTRAQVAAAVLASTEYRTNLIADYFNTYLHRGPTVPDTNFWLPAFTAGITDEQFASQIFGSAEYFALASSSNAVWLSHVYNDVLGRSPTAVDTTLFTAALATNSRPTVALTILTSAEARTRLVQGWFSRFLRRSALVSEVSSLVSALTGGAKDEQIMASILALDAYFNFGTILPTGALSSTTSFWVKATNANGNCSTNSSTATMMIRGCSPPVIVTQPQNTTINVGETATLSVNASGATSYQWYRASSGDPTNPVGTDPVLKVPVFLPGAVNFWVKVSSACGSTNSATVVVTTNCVPPKPVISASPNVPSVQAYRMSWTGNSQVTNQFDLDEARSKDFTTGLKTFQVTTGTSQVIPAHAEITADTRFYYRVRAHPLCGGVGDYSDIASTLVTAPPPATQPNYSLANSPCATANCSMTQSLFIAGFTKTGKHALDSADTFSVNSDKPFITATPSSGSLPPEGTTVTLTVNTTQLGVGSTEATLTVTKVQATSKGVLGTTTATVPVSVSLVTPVSPTPKDTVAPANTVLVPAIAHAEGFNSQFQSDVRITNTAPQPITYLLTYTPSNTDGTQNGKQSSITVDPGETKALNDIVKNWYGSGSLGEPGVGTLEIRPLNYAGKTGVNVSFATIAASRTYNTTANGTFGQYIPAIPLIEFLSKSDIAKISLQQVAQSSAYRTNLGFVEGAGQPVDFAVSLMDDKNNVIATRPYSLRPFEHQQISFSNFFPGVSVTDGRLEVKVTSDTGKVTAYASVLDNKTSDPLLVFPVDPSKVTATRFVVPGVAEFASAISNFHTDMRIFNGSTSATNVTLSFPANSALQPVSKQLASSEVWAIDNVLPTLWNTTGGGSVVAITDNGAPLVVTARTYSRRDDGGTFGQFIPGVTATDAVGVGDRPLQIVQLEQSPAFRSNLGLVEVTGNPVTLDVAAYVPESKIAAHTQVTLAPGQFTQLNSVFAGIGFTSNVYNGRIAVTAIGGTGRAAAYGSVVDNRTLDSTYVPAQ